MARSESALAGLGLAWRPATALLLEQREDLGFTEVIAESLDPGNLPVPLRQRRDAGMAVIPHGIGLSLGTAEPLSTERLDHLAALASVLEAPMVSEHLAMVRAGGTEAGHLLPVPYTREMVDILVENIQRAQRWIGVPLVVENIAALFEWPEAELGEAEFVRTVIERSGAGLLLDASNLYANCRNHGRSVEAMLSELPLDAIAYVHVAGGIVKGPLYHDTHKHPVTAGPLSVVRCIAEHLGTAPPVLLERDGGFVSRAELDRELDAIDDARSVAAGSARSLLRSRCERATDVVTTGGHASLAMKQAALVEALVHGGDAPPGIDAPRFDATRAVLERKRCPEHRDAGHGNSGQPGAGQPGAGQKGLFSRLYQALAG